MFPPSATALNQTPKSCLWREIDAHGLHEPHVSLHTFGIHCQKEPMVFHVRVSFPECPLERARPSLGAPWGGLCPGNLQSAHQESLFQTPTYWLLLKVLVLSPQKGEAFCVLAAVAYTSVCQIFYHITKSRAHLAVRALGEESKQEGHSSFLVPVCCLGQLPALAVPWKNHLKASSDEKLPEWTSRQLLIIF